MIPILSEHPHYLLVAKPAGLFTQAAAGVPSLVEELTEQLRERDQHPGKPFLGLPHRMDRGTSGILLLARNQRALKRLNQQFQARSVVKLYLALVSGHIATPTGTYSDFLRKIEDQPKAEICNEEDQGGREARLHFRTLATSGHSTLVLVQLLTGRMHQIRLQFASRGHSVLGDSLYLDASRSAERTSPEDRFGLHALRLEFRHPQTAQPVVGTASLPPHWEALCPELFEEAAATAKRSQSEDGVQSEANYSWQIEPSLES